MLLVAKATAAAYETCSKQNKEDETDTCVCAEGKVESRSIPHTHAPPPLARAPHNLTHTYAATRFTWIMEINVLTWPIDINYACTYNRQLIHSLYYLSHLLSYPPTAPPTPPTHQLPHPPHHLPCPAHLPVPLPPQRGCPPRRPVS